MHLSDSLAATRNEDEPSEQLERDQPVSRRRFIQIQHQAWIKHFKLIDVQEHLTEHDQADEYREPTDLRQRENALSDRIAKR